VLHFFYGDNRLAMRRTADDLAAKFAAEFGADAVSRPDVQAVEPRGLLGDLVNISLFAPRRLVILSSLNQNAEAWNLIGENLARIPAETDVIITAVQPDKRTRAYKNFVKATDAREFKNLAGFELKRWTEDETRRLSLKITSDALDELINLAGENQGKIAGELAKFAALGRPVDKNLVREIVEPNLAADAFKVLDLAFAGRRAAALDELNRLRNIEDSNKFLGLLASQVFALGVALTANVTQSEAA
jgi:DNA polymerase III delta subunit